MQSIAEILARELEKPLAHVQNVINLLDEGNTIPFIARYRKELHGSMDDTALRTLEDRLNYLRNLAQRREEVKNAIDGQGKLTQELSAAIDNAATLAEVEDLYRPYKQKRRTRATVAREKGLEPLALLLLDQGRDCPAPEEAARDYVDPEKGVETLADALQGANDIVAELLSDDAAIRKTLRGLWATLKDIFGHKSIFVFMLAYFFYIDGVGTIIHMSTSYGAQLGLGDTEMMLALLLVQILGLPFCLMYIKLAGKFGARVMVGVGICIYMGICVFGFFVRETWQFWVLAILVATSQGGIQALSRSMFGKMLPDKNRSGEYFGFFDIFGKFSSVMGPALMGFVTQIATVVLLGRQSLTPETAPEAVLAAAQQEASPWGVLSVLLIFLVGAVLYFGVLPRMLKKEGAGK